MLPLQYGNLLGELVFNHLVHQGYWHTAAAVAQDALAGAQQVSEQDRQVQLSGLFLGCQFECLLQACLMLSRGFVSLKLPAVTLCCHTACCGGSRQMLSLHCVQEVESRQQIMSHVQQGQIDEAVELTDRLAPGLLQQEPQLDFRLRCQKFIELVWPLLNCMGCKLLVLPSFCPGHAASSCWLAGCAWRCCWLWQWGPWTSASLLTVLHTGAM